MTVIVLASNKGGVGKTTLAMSLAEGLARRDSTVVVDSDPQQSARQWWSVADDGERLGFRVSTGDDSVISAIEEARAHHRFVVVDCPPSFGAHQTNDALTRADLVLVPMQPSPVDVWAGAHVADWVRHARTVNPGLRAFIVLNQVEPKTRLWRGLTAVLDELDLPTLATVIRRRAVFRNTALTGATVYATGRQGREAIAEIENLIEEVLVP